MGSYCPKGSITPIPCGAGKFSANLGNTNSSQCNLCTAGYYCPNATTSVPLKCPEGYYCPAGTVRYSLLCDRGYYCPIGSFDQQVHKIIIIIIILFRLFNILFFRNAQLVVISQI
jgi:hypothetical protein